MSSAADAMAHVPFVTFVFGQGPRTILTVSVQGFCRASAQSVVERHGVDTDSSPCVFLQCAGQSMPPWQSESCAASAGWML